jgi:hypothetical protein
MGAPLLKSGASLDWAEGFGEFSIEMYKAFQTYVELDGEYFGLIDDVSYMRPLPDGFDSAAWSIHVARPPIFYEREMSSNAGATACTSSIPLGTRRTPSV